MIQREGGHCTTEEGKLGRAVRLIENVVLLIPNFQKARMIPTERGSDCKRREMEKLSASEEGGKKNMRVKAEQTAEAREQTRQSKREKNKTGQQRTVEGAAGWQGKGRRESEKVREREAR